MTVKKEKATPQKTYRSTYRELDSRKNTILELNSIFERLEN